MIAQTHLQGSIDSLANYLGYGKAENFNRVDDRSRRVAWESGRNLRGAGTIEGAKSRFKQAAARKGRQVEKPVYQIILSWQSGNEENGIPPDNPSREEMELAADAVLSELGLEEHQAWIVAHKDTSAPHIHIAVNRVHPRTGETWKNSFDESILYNRLREIEKGMGWHRPGPMTIEEKWEQKTAESAAYWEETNLKWGRERSVRLWAREEGIAAEIREATSWPEVQQALRGTRAELEARGKRGMVLKRDGGYAALSAIDAQISRPKLEERFGQTWEEYQRESPPKTRKTPPTEEGSTEEGPSKEKDSAEESPEEDPAEKDPAEKDPAEKDPAEKTPEEDCAEEDRAEAETVESDSVEAGPREDRRKIPFGQEVRIRAAPALLEAGTLEELRRRLAPHGLEVQAVETKTDSTETDSEEKTWVVTDREDRVPLREVMPGDLEAQLSGTFAESRSYEEEAASVRENQDKEPTHRERSHRKDIFRVHQWYGVPAEDPLYAGTGAAKKLFRAGPEARKRVFVDLVKAANDHRPEKLEERITRLEEKALEEARLRTSLSERQRALLRTTDRLTLRKDWNTPKRRKSSPSSREASGGEFSEKRSSMEKPVEETPPADKSLRSPVTRYRRLSEEEQAELEERMTEKARKKLRREVQEAREEEMGPARDEIVGHLEEGWWRRAAGIYLSQSEMGRRDLRQMLSEETACRLQEATDEWEEELERARRAREELSGEAQEAFEEARGHLEAATEAPEDEELREPLAPEPLAPEALSPEALSQVAQAWTKVGRELSETDQRALLHQGSAAAMTEEVADSILREARRLREEGRQGRGQSRGHGRGPERGGFRR